MEKAGQEKIKKGLKKRENLEKFREHKLSRMSQNRIFRVLNVRENGQNSRNSQKFLLAKVSAPKVFKKAVAIFIFKSTNFTFIIVSAFTFNFMNFFRLFTRFHNELAINLALSINCNLYDTIFVTSCPFLSILVTSSSIGTKNIMYFPVFSSKQVS